MKDGEGWSLLRIKEKESGWKERGRKREKNESVREGREGLKWKARRVSELGDHNETRIQQKQ